MTALLAGVIAAGAGFLGRIEGSVRTDFEDWSFLRVGYTHFLEPVEYLDAPVPVLELYGGTPELGGAVELGSEGYRSLEIGGRYSWGDIGAWGGVQVGDLNGIELGGLWFLNDDLLLTFSLDSYGVDGERVATLVRMGAKWLFDVDEYTLFIEAALGPVFEADKKYDSDLSCTARFFFTNELGVGVRFSTYGDDYFFPGAEYFVVLVEYHLDGGLGFHAALGGVAGGAFLGAGADYRF